MCTIADDLTIEQYQTLNRVIALAHSLGIPPALELLSLPPDDAKAIGPHIGWQAAQQALDL